jgi:S-methylmethionine-dependent homocysteine/selenocysteine methylase
MMSTTENAFWSSRRYVSDGGLETDLIFNRGVDLPEFASFPLVEDERGRALLRDYYDGYAAVARRAGAGLTLESPTWRANPDWGARVGYDAAALARVNATAIAFLDERRRSYADLDDVRIIGAVGPRGDGYVAGQWSDADEAADYHRLQVESLADAGVDAVAAYTITTAEEGTGIARAARGAGVPVLVGFTVETDGRLPDGTPLRDAVATVDAEEPPDGFVVNCAHPTHIEPALDEGDWRHRIVQVNPNASTLSHAELDAAEELDAGDLGLLATSYDALRGRLPSLAVVGGCCGTDARHVAALWGLPDRKGARR